MRIIASILLFLIGSGLIAYSYIGAMINFAGEVEQVARSGNEISAFSMIVDFILSGEIPQVTGFLYGGLLLIVVSIVNLIRKRSSYDE